MKRIKIDDFIKKSKQIHHDKYDYSLVEYKNNKSKVKIICPKHGIFEQRPYNHLKGENCKYCVNNNILSNNIEFINKSKNIHGDKYDYSLVEYKNNRTKVKIICKEHGIFQQTPNSHLRGNRCPICHGNIKLTNDTFIKNAKNIHGDKYDYSLVEYKNNRTKVKIICKEHGIFEQKPINHTVQKQGCPICHGNIKLTNDTFIKNAKNIHGDKYDYSLVEYKNSSTKIKIICKEHGIFEQTPNCHLIKKQGCPICYGCIKKTTEQFIIDAIKIHDTKYDYSLVEYKNSSTKIKIICKKHGIFEQSPYSHLDNHGCPICTESKGEEKIKKFLIKNNIDFIQQKIFNECFNKLPLRFDFYLPKYNICIEFDGEQHFKPIEKWGGEKMLNDTQKRDQIKNEYCLLNNITIYRIKYDENINEKMNKILNSIFNI